MANSIAHLYMHVTFLYNSKLFMYKYKSHSIINCYFYSLIIMKAPESLISGACTMNNRILVKNL